MEQVPFVVQRAFNAYLDSAAVSDHPLSPAWDGGVRIGDLVASPVADVERANWSATVCDTVAPTGVRLARPLRSTDGRFTVAGWKVSQFVPGEIHARADEVVAASLRLAESMAALPIPRFATRTVPAILSEVDIFDLADRAAWADNPAPVLAVGFGPGAEATEDQQIALENAAVVLSRREEISGADHVCHADMFATTLTWQSQPPCVTGIVCVAHPAAYTAALTMVDAMIAGAANADLIDRFRDVRNIDQLVIRALLYRLYIHALHPQANSHAGTRLTGIVQQLFKGALLP
ncbi:MAG: TIGR02569 family protein [Corynebacterium sp.]|nr:TIGR02569 family protein [Corynebacterium sp.]